MEYFGVKCPVDLEQEYNEILRYLQERWDIHTQRIDLRDVVKEIFEQGIVRGIYHQERIAVWYAYCRDIVVKNIIANSQNTQGLKPIEKLEVLAQPEAELDFSELVEQVYDELTNKQAYFFAEPKNYYRKMQQEHEPEFHGTPLHPIACKEWPSFQEVMSLKNVREYDKLGLSPLKTMISAVLRQGFSVGVYWVDARLGWIYQNFARRPGKPRLSKE